MQFFFLIFYVIPFELPTVKIYASLFVSLLILAQLPCIQLPQDLHNTAFTIIFLPQMLHGSFLLDGLILIYSILLIIAFVSILQKFLSFSLPNPRLSSEIYQMLFSNLQNILFSLATNSSCILLKIKTASIVPLRGIELICISSIRTMFLNVFIGTFQTIFIACSSTFTHLSCLSS